MGNKKRAAFLLLFTHKSEEDLDPRPIFFLGPCSYSFSARRQLPEKYKTSAKVILISVFQSLF